MVSGCRLVISEKCVWCHPEFTEKGQWGGAYNSSIFHDIPSVSHPVSIHHIINTYYLCFWWDMLRTSLSRLHSCYWQVCRASTRWTEANFCHQEFLSELCWLSLQPSGTKYKRETAIHWRQYAMNQIKLSQTGSLHCTIHISKHMRTICMQGHTVESRIWQENKISTVFQGT